MSGLNDGALRIAARLRSHGSAAPYEFDGSEAVVDGGEAIKRMAPRIKELRDHGWRIRTDFRRGQGFYVLVAEPGMPAVPRPAGESDEERFDRTIPPVDSVIANWEADAA